MKAKHSPWGAIQSKQEIAPGIIQINTARHGGFKLDRKMNARVHECMRQAGGWYEEDCKWAMVAITFPELFPTLIDYAHRTMKDYHPDEYAIVTGKPVTMEESMTLRERAFKEKAKGKFQVCSAFGDWHKNVPAGMVGVVACIDGRNEKGMYANELHYFLVPKDEYEGKMIVDPAKYQEVAEFDRA